MAGKREDPDSLEALYTDIQWIKESLAEIKENIKGINDMHISFQQRLAAIETKMKIHDKIIYGIIGATISGFISLIIWILSTI